MQKLINSFIAKYILAFFLRDRKKEKNYMIFVRKLKRQRPLKLLQVWQEPSYYKPIIGMHILQKFQPKGT